MTDQQTSQTAAVQKHGGPKPIWIPALVVLFVALAGATYALDHSTDPAPVSETLPADTAGSH